MYGLMEHQDYASQMQLEAILEIQAAHPKYIVFINVPSSWLKQSDSDPTFFRWADAYLKKNYHIVGTIDTGYPYYVAHWVKN